MAFPIFKKDIFDETKTNMKDIADKVECYDKKDIDEILSDVKRDARGRLLWSRDIVKKILPFFQKYVDPNVKGNVFGCGACATNILKTMIKLQKEWRNPTK